MKEFDNCIAECDKGIDKAKSGHYDYVKLGKALARKALAKLHQKKFDESLSIYSDALLEYNDNQIRDGMKKAEKAKKDYEALEYIDPAKAEEQREIGNKLF